MKNPSMPTATNVLISAASSPTPEGIGAATKLRRQKVVLASEGKPMHRQAETVSGLDHRSGFEQRACVVAGDHHHPREPDTVGVGADGAQPLSAHEVGIGAPVTGGRQVVGLYRWARPAG